MKKYGNMSGWKAIRTLNRDARVASGQSPYGYKVRYSSSNRPSSNTELRFDIVSKVKRDEALRMLMDAYNFLTNQERLDIEILTQKSSEIIALAESDLQSAEQSLLFRSSKVDRCSSKWSSLLIEDAENFLTVCRNLAHIAKLRNARLKKNEVAQGLFEDAIETLFCGQLQSGDSKNKYDSAVRDILKRACDSGVISMKKGQYNVEYNGWEDVVVKRNGLREILISSFCQIILSNSQEFLNRGIIVSCLERSGKLTVDGKTVTFGKLSV